MRKLKAVIVIAVCVLAAIAWLLWSQKKGPWKEVTEKSQRIAALFSEAKDHVSREAFKEAILVYREILEIDPDHFDATLALARTLAWDKQFEEAEKRVQTLLNRKPDNADALVALGNIYGWEKKFDQGISVFKQVLEKNPDHMDALLGLASVYKWKGDVHQSREILKKILKIDPANAEAEKLLKQP